jgi:hypothetical protein
VIAICEKHIRIYCIIVYDILIHAIVEFGGQCDFSNRYLYSRSESSAYAGYIDIVNNFFASVLYEVRTRNIKARFKKIENLAERFRANDKSAVGICLRLQGLGGLLYDLMVKYNEISDDEMSDGQYYSSCDKIVIDFFKELEEYIAKAEKESQKPAEYQEYSGQEKAKIEAIAKAE